MEINVRKHHWAKFLTLLHQANIAILADLLEI